jgi:phage-related protein
MIDIPYDKIPRPLKLVHWLGSSKKDLKNFPDEVQGEVGRALMRAQFGGKDIDAKPWKGLGPGVMEIVSRFDSDTYRAVYTVNIGDVIYVLHAFQKKSKSGISTPREDVELIDARYKLAVAMNKKK